jgi:hypothetical protein
VAGRAFEAFYTTKDVGKGAWPRHRPAHRCRPSRRQDRRRLPPWGDRVLGASSRRIAGAPSAGGRVRAAWAALSRQRGRRDPPRARGADPGPVVVIQVPSGSKRGRLGRSAGARREGQQPHLGGRPAVPRCQPRGTGTSVRPGSG